MTRNVYLLLLSCFLLIHAEGFGQGNKNKGNNGNGNGNGPKDDHSVFPPYGDTGIGTRYPTEKLEVIGNAKISQTIMANDLDVIGVRATTLTLSEDATIGRNLLVSGSVGIGVPVPSEKLDIAGNVRISSTLFSEQVSTIGLSSVTGAFSGRLTAGEDLLISGLTGMGVENPAERLEVSGNIKATQGLLANTFQVVNGSVTSNLTVDNNTIVNGNVGIGVAAPAERLEIAGTVKVSEEVIANSFQVNQGSVNGNLAVTQNTTVDGQVGIGVSAPTQKLDVAGSINASENIISVGIQAEEGTLSRGLTVGEDLLVSGKIGIGVGSASEALDIAGNIKVSGSVSSSSIAAQIVDAEEANIRGDLSVVGTINAGDIKAGILEVDEIRTSNQQFEQLTVSRLGVNTTQSGVPAGYMMAVNGKLLATQVEVFAPQDWPDYVFEDDYRLRPLSEVASFIDQHGHLPDMPSAEAMQQGGYSVSQMDADLLEKIEELTLYMIELKRENEALKLQLESMK